MFLGKIGGGKKNEIVEYRESSFCPLDGKKGRRGDEGGGKSLHPKSY
jgi:hypothetical protein